MTAPKWLEDYYGKELSAFKPEIIADGRKFAIVKIQRVSVPKSLSSSLGYVLLRKGGRHAGGAGHRSLHEGVATQADIDRMMAELQKADQ